MIVETQELTGQEMQVEQEKERILEIPTGNQEEKTGTKLTAEKPVTTLAAGEMTDRELLENINAKLDTVIAGQKTSLEV